MLDAFSKWGLLLGMLQRRDIDWSKLRERMCGMKVVRVVRTKGKKCWAGETKNLLVWYRVVTMNLLGPMVVRERLRAGEADPEVSCTRTGRTPSDHTHLVNREREARTHDNSSHNVARGQWTKAR